MSFAGFGGAIHRAILEDALGPLGVKKKSLDQITRGANSQDIPFSRKLSSCPQNHSSSNMIRQGYEYWYSRLKQAVIDAEDADVNQRSRDRALFEFGEGMHTLQDFYAHSNYLEWLLQNERPLVPVDWDRMPPSIRSEFFYYGNAASNDACCSRELAVRKLCEKDPGLHFHSAERFEERKQSDSCSEALRYALEGKDLLHREVNKDHADTMQGKIVELKTGKTLYRLARELATADTALQWRHLESLIREHYPEKARRIISRLKGDKPAENTTSSPPS